MRKTLILSLISLLVTVAAGVHPCQAQFTIHSTTAMKVAIKGYSGLKQHTLFDGRLTADGMTPVDTSYQGLALLVCENGQQYPFILGEHPFTLNLKTPDTIPSFTGSQENVYFYKRLTAGKPGEAQHEFSNLMIEAKELLHATGTVKTVDELQSMKEKFHTFVRTHYQDLSHSDMLRRLIAQYFMMHEYVDYHVADAPATNIKVQYEQAVIEGARNWLSLLKPHMPEQEILNYCVSLYYDRSMVSLAAHIMENFSAIACCPGEEKLSPFFPPSLLLVDARGIQTKLQELTGKKVIAFVSNDCPFSKVATVIKARSLQPNTSLIVVPLQPLSEKHLALQRMVSGGNILFIDDEKWRKENVPEGMKLPRFIEIK